MTNIQIKSELNIIHSDLDDYGKFLAVCSIDGQILIYKMNNDSNEVNQILTISDAHKSAIWCVKWSNSKFGMILSSCGFD